ncbi:hypothetical protein HID58_042665, partial [Brassica napus]
CREEEDNSGVNHHESFIESLSNISVLSGINSITSFSSSSCSSGSYSGNATEEDDDWEAFAHSLAADDEVNHEKENHSPDSCEGHCYDQVV